MILIKSIDKPRQLSQSWKSEYQGSIDSKLVTDFVGSQTFCWSYYKIVLFQCRAYSSESQSGAAPGLVSTASSLESCLSASGETC